MRDIFILVKYFHKKRNDKHLSELLRHLQYSLYSGIWFVQVLDDFLCGPITLFQALFPLMILLGPASDATKIDSADITFLKITI